MNTERILELADLIEQLPEEKYDQTTWKHDCGSPACIAGWTVFKFHEYPDELEAMPGDEVTITAKCLLGLDWDTAENLFKANPLGSVFDVTTTEAAACLRHLAETGKVQW